MVGSLPVRCPVGEPETAIVPARRLAEPETGHQGLPFRHGGSLGSGTGWAPS